jgi:outer membrane scaffolding protein for murein synthesis (MipA/OmpV family)
LHGYLSLGGAVAPDYEGSNDYSPVPFAAGRLGYDGFYIEAHGPGVRANVLPTGLLPFGLEAGPSFAYRFGRSDVHDDRVDAMRNIDGSFAAGGFVRASVGNLLLDGDEVGFDVETLTGLGSEGTGTTIAFGPSYGFSPLEDVRLGIRATATWASDDYAGTYYRVSSADALRSGFDTYSAKGGMKDVGLSVDASYQFIPGWSLTGSVGITRLLGDAADSPIVKDAGSATQGMATLGVTYGF